MQTIEVKLNQIRHTSGIELRSKIRDGERFYILDGHTVEKIITQLVNKIDLLSIHAKNKTPKVNNESGQPTIQTGNKFGGGYGD